MEKNSVEEKVFISSNQSSGSVSNELGKLAYYSVDRDMLYVMVEGTLYEYNVKKEEEGTLVKAGGQPVRWYRMTGIWCLSV